MSWPLAFIFLLYFRGAGGSGWDCNGGCWVHPNEDLFSMYNVPDMSSEFWNCPSCTSLYSCSTLNPYKYENECYDSDILGLCPDSTILSDANRFLGPLLNMTDPYYFCKTQSCLSGFYFEGSSCQPCVSQIIPNCPKAQHPVRCKKQAFGSPDCAPCTFPVLSNTTVYRYGFGALYPPCMGIQESGAVVLGRIAFGAKSTEYWQAFFGKCAFALTPKWDQGFCGVECSEGYTMTSPAANPLFGHPECAECKTQCPEGSLAPACPGTDRVKPEENGGQCISCGVAIPAHAHWKGHSCEWECDVGYFFESGQCQSCAERSIQANCSTYYYYLNCTHWGPGECTPCFTQCYDGQYLSSPVWQSDCECLPCDRPQLGKTYVLKNCSNDRLRGSNTELAQCVVSCGAGSYMSRNCSLHLNSVCAPCTQAQPGKWRVAACSQYADAKYVDCPLNKSCDGTSVVRDCPGHLRAVAGFCVCPPGMEFLVDGNSDLCIPSVCPTSTYSDRVSGNCKPCSDPRDIQERLAVRPLSNPSLMGLDACYCPPRYFVHVASQGSEYMTCVPCGDLNCAASKLETQQACTGRTSWEPQCVCSVPPGLNSSVGILDGCENQKPACQRGYASTSSAVTNANEYNYDKFNFFYASERKNVSLTVFSIEETWRSLLVLDADYMLALSASSQLVLIYRLEVASSLDLSWFLQIDPQKRLSNVAVKSIRLHTRKKDYSFASDSFRVWVLFSYDGYCDNMEDRVQSCSAVELISLLRKTSELDATFCYLNLCLYWHSSARWGSQFPETATALPLQTFVFGREEDSDPNIYFLVSDHTILRYPLYFSTSYDDSFQTLFSVPPANRTMTSVLDICTGVRGLYLLLKENQLALDSNILRARYSLFFLDASMPAAPELWLSGIMDEAQGLASFDYHLLWVMGKYQNILVDLWNRYVSTYFSDEAEILSRPGAVISNVWGYKSPLSDLNVFQVAAVVDGNSWTVISNMVVCPPDYLLYQGALRQCVVAFCTLEFPCGPYSSRDVGTHQCNCKPGYHAQVKECTACTVASSSNSYCTGRGQQQCPANSVLSRDLASSSRDCYCNPGFFKTDTGFCLPCTVNVICPFFDTLIPIPCNHLGLTLVGQQQNPHSCYCPQRTWGLTCIKCKQDEVCPLEDNAALIPTVETWNIEFVGYIHNFNDLTSCIDQYFRGDAAALDAYSMYIIPQGYSSKVDDYASLALTSYQDYIFFKLIVLLRTQDDYFSNHLDQCMRNRNIWNLRVELVSRNVKPPLFRRRQLCGEIHGQPGFWEWNGLSASTNSEDCICIAGYEPVTVDSGRWTDTVKCYPCLNGTFRAGGSLGRCVPCTDISNEYAPYLAMTECICKPGYVRSDISMLCEPAGEVYKNYISSAPSWYAVISVELNVIIIASSISVAFLVGLILFIYFLWK